MSQPLVGVRPQGQVIGGIRALLSYDRGSNSEGVHMRTVKILAGLVGGIIVLIAVGLLAVWLLVNPNDYKARIATAVKESTGRELLLQGDIKLSVFPWVALQLGPASLGNPPGFGAEPFLAFNRAAVRVRLLPLLAKRLEFDRIELDGLDLRLRKNAQGTGNWENFGRTKAATEESGQSQTGAPLLQLAGISVTNGRVSYPGIVVEKFTLESGAFGGHGVTPINLAFDANRGVAGENVTLNAKFELGADSAMKQWRLEAVNLSGLLSRPGSGDDRPAHWEMSAPAVELDLTGQTVAVPAFAVSYSSARLTGKLQATKILDDLAITGSVTLTPLVLRELAPRLGIALPRTRDPRAFAQLSASSDFAYGASGLRLEQMQAQLDDTHLKGSVALAGEPRAVKFELTVDQIDVDRYLSADHGPATPAAKAAAESAGSAAKPEDSAQAAAASKMPDADGTLSVGALHFSPLDFSNVRLTLGSKAGVVHLYPSLAQIDGGSYSGNITLDHRGATPLLSIDEHLSGVDMARLLAGTSYKGRLSGHGNVNVKATARGAALDSVMQSLNGHFDANLANGALEGIDLAYELSLAEALVKREAQPARSNPPRTKFDAVKMSAEITNGVAKTSDLTISSPVLRVTGQGSANLVSKAIDFQMLASVKSPSATLADIPLKITGTYVDPTVRPDVEGLAKGQLKQKLQDVLKKNGLEGLFGK
jgi:AsmA protein